MYELIRITDRSWYIDCPAKIGVYDAGDGVYIVDAGSDKDAGRRVRKTLDEQGWKLRGILVTHSNADHIGGCQYLQRQTGCKIFAPGIEAQFTRAPILEPSFLYGGYPPKPLRHKFLMAQPSDCLDVTDAEFPKDVQVIPLPGHFFDQCGYLMPDGTAFIADCVSSPETLEKYVFPLCLRRRGLPRHARQAARPRGETLCARPRRALRGHRGARRAEQRAYGAPGRERPAALRRAALL